MTRMLRPVFRHTHYIWAIAFLYAVAVTRATAAAPLYVFSHLAGSTTGGGNADGLGIAARFNNPFGVAIDRSGNIFVSDYYAHTIRKISSTGDVTTFAGSFSQAGYADGTGSNARFFYPAGLAVDRADNVYVADSGSGKIRKITPAGVVTTILSSLTGPHGVAVDEAGDIFVADTLGHCIRKITPTGVATVLAGNPGVSGAADGNGTAARFFRPYGLAVNSTGSVYVVDTYNATVRCITPSGDVTTVAGIAEELGDIDGIGNSARFGDPFGIAIDANDNIYVTDWDNVIRKITPAGAVATVAGSSSSYGDADGTGAAARFFSPRGLAIDGAGNVYIADSVNYTVRKMTSTFAVSTIAGSTPLSGATDGAGEAARFKGPAGGVMDPLGNLFVADCDNHTIRKITSTGTVTTVAGVAGQSGSNDGPISTARFSSPRGLALDQAGNLYVADSGNCVVRKVSVDGAVTTLAGAAGLFGHVDGLGDIARFGFLRDIVIDGVGNLYVADQHDSTIRKISSVGEVTTVAGEANQSGYVDGTGPIARFNAISGMTIDSTGNLYVCENVNRTVRKITPAGEVSTVKASLGFDPSGIAMSSQGEIFLSDPYFGAVHKMDLAGNLALVGGSGAIVPGNVDGIGTRAQFADPEGLVLDSAGNLYVMDTGNHAVRKGTPQVPTLTWSTPDAMVYGTLLSPSQLTASASLPGKFTYSPASGALLDAGTRVLSATFLPDGAPSGYAPLSAQVSLTVTKAVPSVSWGPPAGILYGEPLGPTQLNATASVPGTFVYTPAAGTVVHAGESKILTVDFSPADTVNYAAVSSSTTIAVSKVVLTIAATDRSKIEGAANPVLTLNYSGFVNGDTSSSIDTLPFASTTATATSVVGTYPINLTGGGDNDYTLTLQNGTLTVAAAPIPSAITSATTATASVGLPFYFVVTASGTPSPNFHANGLPPWASLNSTTGEITGTPLSASGSLFTVMLTAANTVDPDASQMLTLTVLDATSRPAVIVQPTNQTVQTGAKLTFSVGVTGAPAPSYRWQVSADAGAGWSDISDGGMYAGANTHTLSIAGATDALNNYQFRCVATNSVGTAVSSSAVLLVTERGQEGAFSHLVNISARGYCGGGDRVMIGGFVVNGGASKRVLVRAVGPSLTSQGIGVAEMLLDPLIEVHQGATVIASNDNWVEATNAAEITATAAQIGATALASSDTKSSALLLTLQPGVYSFVASGKSGTSGIVLLEVYDADSTTTASSFVNIATRAYATTGNGVTIGGFVISGNAPKQVLLRGVGPTLTKQGLSDTDVLVDPTIELHDALHGNATIATNDNWGDNTNASLIGTTAARIGATPFDVGDTKSSALLVTLQPGVYSFIASGKSAASGIVLVEVYDAD